MKKWGVPLLITGILLAGCSAPESEAVMESSTIVEEPESKPVSRSTFKSGDPIIEMIVEYEEDGAISKRNNAYYFGGFSDEDTLLINTSKNDGYNYSTPLPSLFTFEKGSIIILPMSKTKVKVLDFDIKKNTITLEQLK